MRPDLANAHKDGIAGIDLKRIGIYPGPDDRAADNLTIANRAVNAIGMGGQRSQHHQRQKPQQQPYHGTAEGPPRNIPASRLYSPDALLQSRVKGCRDQ